METEKNLLERIINLFNSGEWKKIRDAICLLKENTGRNLIFDPYKDPDRLLWNNIGIGFLKASKPMEALTVFQSQLQCYLDIQEETKERIH